MFVLAALKLRRNLRDDNLLYVGYKPSARNFFPARVVRSLTLDRRNYFVEGCFTGRLRCRLTP
jgi:hypothetical protein